MEGCEWFHPKPSETTLKTKIKNKKISKTKQNKKRKVVPKLL